MRVIETGEGSIELEETGGDGEIGAIGKVLAAFEFKGGKLRASTNFTSLNPLCGIRIGPPPVQMASH